MNLDDGLIAVVKRDCPTCLLIEPVLQAIEQSGQPLTVYTQDDPAFPDVRQRRDDRDLECSYRLAIETVPTLIRVVDGAEQARTVGWARDEWASLTGIEDIGVDLPSTRPGCGSKSVEPHIAEQLALRYGDFTVVSRRIEVSALEDDIEYCFDRGWSDGLPVVPPTEARLYRMLQGTQREPGEVLGEVPPNLVALTVEKVALNAVMAGCRPEYLPVVLAAVEAALDPAFCLHGLLADQSTFGHPGKYTFCFAEDEATPWQSLGEERGIAAGKSSVTVFSGDGVQGVVDQQSREPQGLIDSIAGSLRAVNHVQIANAADVVVVIGPEHGRVFDQAGWSKADVTAALHEHTRIPGKDLGMGGDTAQDAAPGPQRVQKFRPGGLQLIRAGGDAGLFSAIIPGWLMKGPLGTDPVTKEIRP